MVIERLSNLPKVTKLVSGRAGIQTWRVSNSKDHVLNNTLLYIKYPVLGRILTPWPLPPVPHPWLCSVRWLYYMAKGVLQTRLRLLSVDLRTEVSLDFPGGPSVKSQEPLKVEKSSPRGSRERWRKWGHRSIRCAVAGLQRKGAGGTCKANEDLSLIAARNRILPTTQKRDLPQSL